MGTSLFDLAGQVAVVTGSSRGIGLAAARALAGQGATVVLNGRRPEAVLPVRDALRADGLAVDVACFDVNDVPAATAALDELQARHGRIDIFFANAGINHRAPLLEFEQPVFEQVLFTNLTAQWAIARHAARHMVARGHGRILFTGSVTALRGRRNVTAYTAAKGALHALVRQWSAELADRGVTVNALAPGYIRTELTQALQDDAEFDAWLRAATPAGRWGTPQDLAAAVVFISSREAGFMTGQVLTVDGGLTAAL
ncbi:SDR family oxidoreductase [Aquincola sp. MAHUQ-54]|uniref:SDR family oxidoreductase n=1 Tax=Aquincola agrisoli TaxID=3119538 RepID=A0AAW9Q692_9BURK